MASDPGAAALCRAGHLQGDPVPVLVRWSNGSPNAKTGDDKPDVRGLSVSFPARIVDGIELSDDPILRYRPAAYSASVSRRLKSH